ncbi:hypothetical protein DdX_19429 [Ditylenchus destructor]|uniref:NTF2 domain-containing protein n=1 Tax=Ditylenchus destructor TaxID=166010 RepID=A0AAD4MIF4_9BILA|nr:hypothetical protein DdX_19429 [Ditylenchus destructor]
MQKLEVILFVALNIFINVAAISDAEKGKEAMASFKRNIQHQNATYPAFPEEIEEEAYFRTVKHALVSFAQPTEAASPGYGWEQAEYNFNLNRPFTGKNVFNLRFIKKEKPNVVEAIAKLAGFSKHKYKGRKSEEYEVENRHGKAVFLSDNMSNSIPLDDEQFLDDDQLQMFLTSFRHTSSEGNSREPYMNQDQDFSQNECCSNLQSENRCESIECYTKRTELMHANQDLKARLKEAEEKARHFTKIVAGLTKELHHCQSQMQKYQDMLSGYNKEKSDLSYTNKDLRIKPKTAEEKANICTTTVKSAERSYPIKHFAPSNLNMKPQRMTWKPDFETSMDGSRKSSSSGPKLSDWKVPGSTANDFTMNQQRKMLGDEIQKSSNVLNEKEAQFKTTIKSTERSSPIKHFALSNLNTKPQIMTWKPDFETSMDGSRKFGSSGPKLSDWKVPGSAANDINESATLMNQQRKMLGDEIQKSSNVLNEKEAQFKELTINCNDSGCKDFMRAYLTAINSDSKERLRKLSAFYPAVISELIIENRKYNGRESILDAWQKFWGRGYEVVMRSFKNKRQDNGRTLIVTVFGDLLQNDEFMTKYRQTLWISKPPHHAGQIKKELIEYIEEEQDGI